MSSYYIRKSCEETLSREIQRDALVGRIWSAQHGRAHKGRPQSSSHSPGKRYSYTLVVAGSAHLFNISGGAVWSDEPQYVWSTAVLFRYYRTLMTQDKCTARCAYYQRICELHPYHTAGKTRIDSRSLGEHSGHRLTELRGNFNFWRLYGVGTFSLGLLREHHCSRLRFNTAPLLGGLVIKL